MATINQSRRYGIKVEELADATRKSVPTVYNWQRTNAPLLDAVAQHQRNLVWGSQQRQAQVERFEKSGIALPASTIACDTSSPLGLFNKFMYFLSGTDLWCMREAYKKAQDSRESNEHIYLDVQIIADAIDLQIALCEGDAALIIEVAQSLESSISQAAQFPEIPTLI